MNHTYYYLIAQGQPGDRAIYYTGLYTMRGEEVWGNAGDAYWFKSQAEALKFLVGRDLECPANIIVPVADVTLRRIMHGREDWLDDKHTELADLFHKFNTISYITNSRKED